MKLAVEILTGTLFFVEVSDDYNASGQKDEIAVQEDLHRKRLILFLYDGDSGQLIFFGEDEAPLAELGFGNRSHVYFFLRPVEDEKFFQLPGQPGGDASTLNLEGDRK